jgi:hypothetical protein
MSDNKKIIKLIFDMIDYIDHNVNEDYGYLATEELKADHEMPKIYYDCFDMLEVLRNER